LGGGASRFVVQKANTEDRFRQKRGSMRFKGKAKGIFPGRRGEAVGGYNDEERVCTVIILKKDRCVELAM